MSSSVLTMVGYAEPRFIGMKRTALVERASRSGTYVMCVDSGGNPESLEVRKIYRALPDAEPPRLVIFVSSMKAAKATSIRKSSSSA